MKMIHFDSFMYENLDLTTKAEKRKVKYVMNVVEFFFVVLFMAILFSFVSFIMMAIKMKDLQLAGLISLSYVYFIPACYNFDPLIFENLYKEKKYFKISMLLLFSPIMSFFAVSLCSFHDILNKYKLLEKEVLIEGKKHTYIVTLSGEEQVMVKGKLGREDMLPAVYKHHLGGTSMYSENYYRGKKYDLDKVLEKYKTFENFKMSFKIKNI
jgi:hypothetical protein